MSRTGWFGWVLVIGLALAGCKKDGPAGDASAEDAAPDVEWTLRVHGAVQTPLTLSWEDLQALPQAELSGVLMDRTREADSTNAWQGVALAELLRRAGAPDPHGALTATSQDGYAVVIDPDELDRALIATRQDGAWIADADPIHGPIRLVCPGIPANRWVFQLVSLEVAAAEDPATPAGDAAPAAGADG